MLQPSSIIEREWLQALKFGKGFALRKIHNHYHNYLMTTGYNLTGNYDNTKDIIQDVFFELWKKREIIYVQTSLKSYLRRAMINRSINYMKSQNRFSFWDENFEKQVVDNTLCVEKKLEIQELKSAINIAVNNLSPRCKIIFMLSRYEKLSHKEIASILNISTKTIEAQITKALKILRKTLEKYENLS